MINTIFLSNSLFQHILCGLQNYRIFTIYPRKTLLFCHTLMLVMQEALTTDCLCHSI